MTRQHAIVMGGSMAGLLTARVLSNYYKEVTVIERDAIPEGAANRRGVPHGKHTHGLLASGRDALEGFFPGITQSLVAKGAITGDLARDMRWFFEGGCLSRPASGWQGLLLTRPMLESEVRARVAAIPNVRMWDNTAVQRLATCTECRHVTGVYTRGQLLAADLVVDATGRGSHTPKWLEEMGYEKPREEAVQIGLAYTTRFFERRATDLGGDLGAIVSCTPEGKRGGVMIAQEGDRWTVTLISHFGKFAPKELEGFIEYARTLPDSSIYEVIRQAAPAGEAATLLFPASVRRRYELLTRFPIGYLVTGDALCSFNPIYGQGMSVAALEALELETLLAEGAENLAAWFFARTRKLLDIPWSMAVGADLRMPEVEGRRTLGLKFVNWYISRLHRAAHSDPAAALAFLKVANLLAPPGSIMHPRIALRVLWSNLTRPSERSDGPDRRSTPAAHYPDNRRAPV